MPTDRRKIAVVALCLILAGFVGFWFWAQLRPYEPGDVAHVSWTDGGVPRSTTVTVLDPAGIPLPGVDVSVNDAAGAGGMSGTTDPSGTVTLMLGNTAVTDMSINNTPVLGRPLAELLGRPKAGGGLV